MSSAEEPSRSVARAMIRSLTRGTTVAKGARYIHIGHEMWLRAQREVLEEIAEDGYSETKFVRGAYGSGKSHFLVVVQDIGREMGWATAHVECKADGVQIDRFETLYPKIVAKLRAPDHSTELESNLEEATIDPIRALLDGWCRSLQSRVGIREDGISRPFDAESRIHTELERGLLRSNLPSEFTKSLAAYARAGLAGDFETTNAVIDWMKGDGARVRISKNYLRRPGLASGLRARDTFELRPIGTGTAQEALRSLLWLIRTAGYPGLVLCIDEIEELAKLGNRRRRDQALQALREHVDNAGGDSGYHHLCLFLAATPEMFENPDYFPRYDALATRIQPVSEHINWRAPIIDLDRTPLDAPQMKVVAKRIWNIHRIAYGRDAASLMSESLLDGFVDEVVRSRFRIAKPRLLARVMVDELERARQAGDGYEPPDDLGDYVLIAADKSSEEAEL